MAGPFANSGYPDQMPHSDLGLTVCQLPFKGLHTTMG